MSVEERLQRSRKAASIRKMLTQSTGFLDTIGSQAAGDRTAKTATKKKKSQIKKSVLTSCMLMYKLM